MTIKKRLAISNLFMILVPVCISGLVAVLCAGAVWFFVAAGGGVAFADSGDFYRASRAVAAAAAEALEESDPARQTERLAALSSALDKSAMALAVVRGGEAEPFYAYGTQSSAADAALLRAVQAMGGEGFAASAGRGVLVRRVQSGSQSYELRFFGSEAAVSYSALKAAAVLACVGVAAAVAASVCLTDRFLVRFVLRKIEQPLDILACGVREIGSGNLAYRIQYTEQDEFAPICAQFNAMAAHLKASVDEAQRQEQSRKELMASLSHDLRSPITAILAYAEGLLDGVAAGPEKQREYLLTIRAKAEQLRDMVAQIFLYSKMELEAFPVKSQSVRLDEQIPALVSALRADYAARGLAIAADCPQPVPAAADMELLRRCIVNILDNSAKYKTAPHGRAVLCAAVCAQGARLTITDDGPGVPAEALPKLFEVFYRSDAARSSPEQGSGLGLAIAARAVGRMGGTIAASNAVGGGLCIEIILPGEVQNAENTDC